MLLEIDKRLSENSLLKLKKKKKYCNNKQEINNQMQIFIKKIDISFFKKD